jgi:hypothetical protein
VEATAKRERLKLRIANHHAVRDVTVRGDSGDFGLVTGEYRNPIFYSKRKFCALFTFVLDRCAPFKASKTHGLPPARVVWPEGCNQPEGAINTSDEPLLLSIMNRSTAGVMKRTPFAHRCAASRRTLQTDRNYKTTRQCCFVDALVILCSTRFLSF